MTIPPRWSSFGVGMSFTPSTTTKLTARSSAAWMRNWNTTLLQLFFWALMWIPHVAAVGDGDNYFVNPPAAGPYGTFTYNPSYEAGNELVLRWQTNITRMNCVLWQPAVDGVSQRIFDMKLTSDRYRWIIDVSQFDINGVNSTSGTPRNVFYFYAYDDSTSLGFTSHYFNVTQRASITTGSNAVAPSATTTYLSATYADPTTTTIPSPSDPSSYAYDASSGSPRSNRLAFGLALGLGIPGIILIGISSCLYLNHRAKKYDKTDVNSTGQRPPAAAMAAFRNLGSDSKARAMAEEHPAVIGMTEINNASAQSRVQTVTEHFAPPPQMPREHFAPIPQYPQEHSASRDWAYTAPLAVDSQQQDAGAATATAVPPEATASHNDVLEAAPTSVTDTDAEQQQQAQHETSVTEQTEKPTEGGEQSDQRPKEAQQSKPKNSVRNSLYDDD